jgi:broad specificity phosphatase PhoE
MQVWLMRHGETAWSASGQHTGRTDIALTERGERQAQQLRKAIAGQQFALVLTSPLRRARDTCRIADCSDHASVEPDLSEWDYGAYEGRTSAEIRAQRPNWMLFDDGVESGETIEQVCARADRVIARALAAPGDVALFAHGHILRILGVRWIGLEPRMGRAFILDTASICVLAHENGARAIRRWNGTSHLQEKP